MGILVLGSESVAKASDGALFAKRSQPTRARAREIELERSALVADAGSSRGLIREPAAPALAVLLGFNWGMLLISDTCCRIVTAREHEKD